MKPKIRLISLMVVSLFVISVIGNNCLLGTAVDRTSEPNDSFATAGSISVNIEYTLNIDIANDEDFYNVTLVQGKSYSIYICPITCNEIDLEIFDATSSLKTSSTVGDDKITMFDIVQTGIFTVFVLGYSTTGSYTLKVTEIIDDIYENNDDFDSAYLINTRSLTNLVILDEDYYKFYMYQGLTMRVNSTRDNSVISANNLYLYDCDRLVLGNSLNINCTLTFTASKTGYHYIRINDAGLSSRGVTYNISIEYLYEPDESNPTVIGEGEYFGFGIETQQDIDNFEIDLIEGDFITILISELNYEVSLFFQRIIDSVTYNLDQDTSDGTGNKIVEYWIQESATYSFSIHTGLSKTPYRLTINTESVMDDSFEENDVAANAAILQNNTYTNLRLFDADYYKINVSKGMLVTLTIFRESISNSNPLYGVIYNPDNTIKEFEAINQTVSWIVNNTDYQYIYLDCYDTNVMGIKYSISINVRDPSSNNDTTNNSGGSNDTGGSNIPPENGIDGFSIPLLISFAVVGLIGFSKMKRKLILKSFD